MMLGDSKGVCGGVNGAERYRHRGFSATEKDLILERMASWDLDQGARFSSFHFQCYGDGADAQRVGGGKFWRRPGGPRVTRGGLLAPRTATSFPRDCTDAISSVRTC